MNPARRRPWLIVLWLIFFFPVGLFLVWKASPWSARGRWTATGVTAAYVLIISTAAAAGPSPATTPAAAPQPAAPTAPASPSTPQPVAATTAPAPTSPTPNAAATSRPAAAHTSTNGDVVLAGGIILPNRLRTPGATNAAVTQASIHTTVCLSGYTSTIRPSSSYTTSLKVQQLATGYAWHGDRATSDYEEDHLISLELGGAAASARNLWPEPYAAREGARVKDLVENKLHDLVCSGALSLRTAQQAIATNWWRAYQTYGGLAMPRVFEGSYGQASQSTGTQSSGTQSSGSGTDPRFGTCKEAIANGYGPYYRGKDPEYDWYVDRDGDGIVCER